MRVLICKLEHALLVENEIVIEHCDVFIALRNELSHLLKEVARPPRPKRLVVQVRGGAENTPERAASARYSALP